MIHSYESTPLQNINATPPSRRLSSKVVLAGAALGLLMMLGLVANINNNESSSSYFFWYFPGGRRAAQTRSVNAAPFLSADAKADFISNLPGLPPQNWKHDAPASAFERQFSGYLHLANGANVHYWFVESQDSPANDPVALWLNGGPGASSLGGLLSENGPFAVNDDGKTLRRNPYAWNRHSSILYLESPVGVGFSYNSSGIYESNDLTQASDNYEALELFFKKFPHLLKNEFYVTGESYGGVYVPTLAWEIVQRNNNNTSNINLKGFAVGNGVNEFSANSQLYFGYYHGLFGADLWKELREECPDLQEFTAPSYNFFDVATGVAKSSLCGNARIKATMAMMSAHINSYDIYRKCSHGDANYGIIKFIKQLQTSNSTSSHLNTAQPMGLPMDLCLNSTASKTYLNNKVVKDAIHVPTYLSWSDIVMTNTSFAAFKALNVSLNNHPVLNYGMPLQGHVVSYWKKLLQANVRGVIYHGDVDYMCDFIGGQWAVDSMGLNVTKPYQPWNAISNNGAANQTSGFVKEFNEGLMTYVTVKGAGHMVPQWKPKEALHMFEKFILRNANLDA